MLLSHKIHHKTYLHHLYILKYIIPTGKSFVNICFCGGGGLWKLSTCRWTISIIHLYQLRQVITWLPLPEKKSLLHHGSVHSPPVAATKYNHLLRESIPGVHRRDFRHVKSCSKTSSPVGTSSKHQQRSRT
jgi:hypothetical protein